MFAVIAAFAIVVNSTAAQISLTNPFHVAALATAAAAGDSCSGCTNETFEGTGYSVAGWVEGGGTVENEDYTTSPAPLNDSQSLLLRNSGFDNANSYLVMPSDTEGWMRFRFVVTNTVVNGLTLATFSDNTSAHQFRLLINSSQLRVAAGATTANTAGTIAAGTTYYCWLHFKTGSGNAEMSVAASTSKTRPTSGGGFASFNTGTVTVNMEQYALMAGDLAFAGPMGGVIFDHVSYRNGATPIGDFP